MAWDSSMTVLMIWLVSDFCTLMLVCCQGKEVVEALAVDEASVSDLDCG